MRATCVRSRGQASVELVAAIPLLLALAAALAQVAVAVERRVAVHGRRARLEHRLAHGFERVRRRDPRIGYGTVYRTLHLLAEHGLIQELTFADQASRYDARVERHDRRLDGMPPALRGLRRRQRAGQ